MRTRNASLSYPRWCLLRDHVGIRVQEGDAEFTTSLLIILVDVAIRTSHSAAVGLTRMCEMQLEMSVPRRLFVRTNEMS